MKHLDFTILDLVCLEIVFYLSFLIRHGMGLGNAPQIPEEYRELGITLIFVDISVVFFSESYKNILRRSYLKEGKAVLKHMTLMACGVLIYLFLMKTSTEYSRQVLIITYLVGTCVLYIERNIRKKILLRQFENIGNFRSIMIVTTAGEANKLINGLIAQAIRNYKITALAVTDQDMRGQMIGPVKVILKEADIFQYACTQVVDEVFIAIPNDSEKVIGLTSRFLDMGLTVHIDIEQPYHELPNRVFESLGGIKVMTTGTHLVSSKQLFLKRGMDIAGAVVGIMIAGTAGLFVGPMIYMQSPGPIIFKQERVGKNGRLFYIYKFRSMYLDAERRKQELMSKNKMTGQMFKMEDDPRILPHIGKFIRKTSIDELPQFWNVLWGEMSLVGTRPPTVDEYEQYECHHKRRLSIKPGITGLWQVSGRNSITDFEAVTELDSQYINQWSLGLDVKILLKTVKTVFRGEGAG